MFSRGGNWLGLERGVGWHSQAPSPPVPEVPRGHLGRLPAPPETPSPPPLAPCCSAQPAWDEAARCTVRILTADQLRPSQLPVLVTSVTLDKLPRLLGFGAAIRTAGKKTYLASEAP